MLSKEVREHLAARLVPFWKKMRDPEYGGYYGWMDARLAVDRKAVKGCILNSRILWFFSNAAMCMEKDKAVFYEEADSLREYADWAYFFLRDKCLDREKGGVYWSVDYTGAPEDATKHTYNQAFAVYALSSYYRAFHDREALVLAEGLIQVIETECFDGDGYREALDRTFHPIANDKLSENGVLADRTMNTLLHILEAYTEYLLACREAKRPGCGTGAVTGENSAGLRQKGKASVDENAEAAKGAGPLPWESAAKEAGEGTPQAAGAGRIEIGVLEQVVRRKLHWILDLIEKCVYNPVLRRQEVFFNLDMESLIDLHSYGHDIEAAWLLDRCLEVLGEEGLSDRISPILRSLEAEVYRSAYANHSLANECERGNVDTKRVWWVQAEGVVGFYNAWQKTGELRYREAAEEIWRFIREHLVDKREEGEWFWCTDKDGAPALDKPIVEPWKCPYHNGRMCMEMISRTHDIE